MYADNANCRPTEGKFSNFMFEQPMTQSTHFGDVVFLLDSFSRVQGAVEEDRSRVCG